jgi:hypothetical protein
MVWITTDNVSAEAWRHLLEYANHDLAVEAIIEKHGRPDKKTLANYSKQAHQLRAAILQAREYFDAAEHTSLITSPNHLYYGLVSLCSAIMLLHGDGTKSLDMLRKNKENNHHGLDFSTSVNSSSCKDGLNILSNSFTSVRKDGFFHQWYSVLPASSPVYGLIIKLSPGGNGGSIDRGQVGTEDNKNIQAIIGHKASLLELLTHLPDLNTSLKSYGVAVPSSRADFKITVRAPDDVLNYEWRIHGAASPDLLQSILNRFVLPGEHASKLTTRIYESGHSCIVNLARNISDEQFRFSYPSYRETINNELIMYGDKHLDTLEIVDAYLTAYGLSMLSRYFPDIWVSCLESHCKAAKLIEKLVFTLTQKAPVLTLALMHSDDFVISTHRAPWQSAI